MEGKTPMSTVNPTLEQFIKFVPYCQSQNSLETMLSSFGDYNRDFLVVVNNNNIPLGIISAGTALRAKTDNNYSLHGVTALLSPVSTVSEQLTLQQLLPYLERAATEEKILVVDARGKLRGELDTESILQVLLRSQKPSPEKNFTSLLDFLDQFPLPLMLQTKEGKLLHKNSSWEEKICTQGENCCLLTPKLSEDVEKQWCNLISSPSVSTSRKVSGKNSRCPLFPLTMKDNLNAQGSGVWQFTTLNLPNSELGSLWLVLATDISEQRQLCKELAAKNADLVQLNRLKDEFLACITHELKSPLTAIVGLSNLMGEKSIGDLNERQQRYVKQIYQSGRQLMNLVNDLLDLARLETGQLQLHPEVVNVKQVCDRAYEEARQQTPDFAPQFTFNLEPNLETIIADELRLRQMLVHLLANAQKFTAEEGEMGLEVNAWEGWIAFTVWDTGMGIPEASQHLIFQKFQQLEDPMTRQFSGTGLGLVLTQRLAQAHGGDVSFISEEGKGSQFTLLLPPTPAPKPFQSQAHSQQQGGKLVLVVEAVPQYLKEITKQLQELGYRVAIARSGTEALLKARTFQPCTILLNPVLPLLSGWDVLTLIKSHPSSCHLPVVVTGTRGEKEEAMNNGADAFLTLPVAKGSLDDVLLACAAPRSPYRKCLTVLRLHYADLNAPPKRDRITEILSSPPETSPKNVNYRILEADDPEQAELLQRIWHPDVLLLTGDNIPRSFITAISEQDTLPNLPLVCLETESARYAHQTGKLSVYPCLKPITSQHTLWSVLRFAAGISPPPRKTAPYVVVADGKRLNQKVSVSPHRGSEWLNAFVQYLTTAGYRTSLSHSWEEVYQQAENQGADLLLLDLKGTESNAEAIAGLEKLRSIEHLPIIAIAPPQQLLQDETLHQLLTEVATKILPNHPQSMLELLRILEEQMGNNNQSVG